MQGWIRTEDEWRSFLARAQAESVVAVCLQTSGPDPFTAEITSTQLATRADVVSLAAADLGGPRHLAELLAPLLTGAGRVKAFHHAKPSLRFLLRLGLVLERIFDSMLADQLLSYGEIQNEPDLAETVGRHLDSTAAGYPAAGEEALWWAPQTVFRLREALIPRLLQAGLVRCAQLEFECSRVTAEIENAGLRFDAARLHNLIERGRQRMEEATANFAAAFGVETPHLFGQAAPINLGSDSQLLTFLQARGVPLTRVSARALHPFLEQYPGLHHVLAYRQASGDRALSSYLDCIHPVTGRVHPTYTQMAAATGRYGCSNPGIQSFPRTSEHRACVVPAPGRVLVVADYSQIELRIAAQISNDRRMLEAFRRGEDLHRLTASILQDKPPGAVDAQERQAAKAVNFGLIYAMGARSLVEYAKQQYGVEMTLAEAEQFRTRYFQAYAGVHAWHEHMRRSKPATVRTLSGRLRRVAQSGLPIALNSPVQGTGADILKQALVLLSPALRPLGAQIVAIVHDEIIVETPTAQAEAVRDAVGRLMQSAACMYLPHVPCPVEAVIGRSWADKG